MTEFVGTGWCQRPVCRHWLTQARIANGYSDGTFGPTRAVARQTMASFLYNLDNLDA